MALRSLNQWSSVLSRRKGSSRFATSTAAKSKAYSPAAEALNSFHEEATPRGLKGEFVPVYVAIGMIALSGSLGLYTAMHQLRRCPNVCVRKSKRETLLEVVEPEQAMEEADQFIKKSFFRKLAHVQEFYKHETVPDPIRADIFALKPRAVTLKDAGVDPKQH